MEHNLFLECYPKKASTVPKDVSTLYSKGSGDSGPFWLRVLVSYCAIFIKISAQLKSEKTTGLIWI
jgi:hypothetical protein